MFEISLMPRQNVYISEWYPNHNFSNSTALFLGRYQQEGDSYRSLIEFDLNEIPLNCRVKNATLELCVSRNELEISSNISIYQVLSAWQEKRASWHSSPRIKDTPVSNFILNEGFNDKVYLDLTELIKSWHEGLIPNYGMIIKGKEQFNNLVAFHSTRFHDKKQWPALYINYESKKSNISEREELLIPKYPPYAPLDVSSPIILGTPSRATFLIKNNSDSRHVAAIAQIGYSNNPNETFFNTGNWIDLNAEGYPGEAVALTVTDLAEYARVLVKGKGGEKIDVWVYTSLQ